MLSKTPFYTYQCNGTGCIPALIIKYTFIQQGHCQMKCNVIYFKTKVAFFTAYNNTLLAAK